MSDYEEVREAKEGRERSKRAKVKNINRDVGFSVMWPEPGPTERSEGTTELSQFESR